MIIESGTQTPTATQRRIVRAIADDSFLAMLPYDFGDIPCGSGWQHDEYTGIALRMKCVDPHVDTWVGLGPEPKRYAAVFWLIDTPKFGFITVQVGVVAHRMTQGDFVVFDDRVIHSVFSRRVWHGCAYQVRPAKRGNCAK